MDPALVGAAFAILGIAVVLFALPPLFERMAGWAQLAQRFVQASDFPCTRIGYATLGVLATAPVRLGGSPQGLVLTLVFAPFRPSHALLIPWRSISEVNARGSFLIVSFNFPPASEPRLFVKPRVARRIRPYLAVGSAA
jgi:hypothetical protein